MGSCTSEQWSGHGTRQRSSVGPADQALDQGGNPAGNGLTFTLSAAGVAGWILRYRHGGRRRELTIGRYPDIGLADARGLAMIKRAEIMQGRNPAADKQKAKATAAKDWTVREIEASDVVALIEASALTWGESNMLLITTKCLFTHACGKRLIMNPHSVIASAAWRSEVATLRSQRRAMLRVHGEPPVSTTPKLHTDHEPCQISSSSRA